MTALAELYEEWALTEERISPEQRTRLIQLSSDYERIAESVGAEWAPELTGGRVDAVQFIARTVTVR
jgi:hypothetical protein